MLLHQEYRAARVTADAWHLSGGIRRRVPAPVQACRGADTAHRGLEVCGARSALALVVVVVVVKVVAVYVWCSVQRDEKPDIGRASFCRPTNEFAC